jgi:hypothetical protein
MVQIVLFLCLGHGTSQAGSLVFYASAAGPGSPLQIQSPASEELIDLDYSPASAEGNGFYGFSEVLIVATGDVNLSSTGFVCQSFGCLSAPSNFVGGPSIVVSAADNLAGEFTNNQDLMTLSVNGSQGHVVLVSGEYLDATGLGPDIGAIQQIELTILATVPEPRLGLALAAGGLLLGAVGSRLNRRRQGCDSTG